MDLIIVESPTKSRTLNQFLGKDFRVAATLGHIRDLPAKKLGVDLKNHFQPQYLAIPKKRETIKKLGLLAKKAQKTILAMDPDREGEAIAWHTKTALKLAEKRYQRIVFHEITRPAIQEALQHPRKIDMDLVNAQQARRILDRIVGYKLSPFLWRKVSRGLSAGRVQSVALRLVVEREKEIKNFVPQEYWTIGALFLKPETKEQFWALLIKEGQKLLDKLAIENKKEAEKIVEGLKAAGYQIQKVEKKELKRQPLPPFTTSTLQQEAWQRFHWPAEMTMALAQSLYEKGLITYHRSDSVNLSNQAQRAAKKFILAQWPKEYFPGFSRTFKTKSKLAQEAHEAIRPTDVAKGSKDLSQSLDPRQERLYDLIWKRFLACQMSEALFDTVSVEIEAQPKKGKRGKTKNYVFGAKGQTLRFDGFLKVYPLRYEEVELPSLKAKEFLELLKLKPDQHFTQPPARYSEATLIKTLEKNGIGRPSTYAPTISVLRKRNYLDKDEKKKFFPTEIGFAVNDILVDHFPEIVDLKFTAFMEDDLDKIAQGKKDWEKVLAAFYEPFAVHLEKKYKEVTKTMIVSEKKCPQCQANLVIRLGRFGKFYGCSGFPKCKFTQAFEKETLGISCPKCQKGEIMEKRTKTKKIFYGCNRWPQCDFALWDKPSEGICQKCGSLLVKTKSGKTNCSNKYCDSIEK